MFFYARTNSIVFVYSYYHNVLYALAQLIMVGMCFYFKAFFIQIVQMVYNGKTNYWDKRIQRSMQILFQ